MASTVDGAITALCALLSASGDLTGVTVHDGPPMTAETPEWIAIGYQPDTVDSVQLVYEWAALGQRHQEEHYDILCSLVSTSGDEAIAARRSRAIALRDAVAAVLADNPTLSDTVRIAHLSGATLRQQQTSQGALAGFTFTVSVQARISQ